MSDLQNVFKKIQGYREEIIKLQEELTAKPALCPENNGTGEHDKAALLKERIKELKPDQVLEIKVPDQRARDGYRPNVIARWKGRNDQKTVWVLSHMDIVPPGDLTLWNSNPYQIKVEGDKIYGRGVEDDQHGIVSSFMAVKAVREAGLAFEHSVALVFAADEETGSKYGLEYMVDNQAELFKPNDFIIVPDGGNSDGTMVEIGEKGSIGFKFTVNGKQCHASSPGKGNNSLYGAARLIVALQELKAKFNLQDPLYSPPYSTFEPTKMEANVPNINTIPGRDIFYMDCRVLPQYPLDEIIQAVQMIIKKIEAELNLKVQLDFVKRHDAAPVTSIEAPVVKALEQAIREIIGREPKIMGMGGGTVAAFFRKKGLPAVVWSTMNDTAHQANEYCDIQDIMTDAKVFAYLFLK
ncbi:MAG: M20 family metallo-hydrolase [Desulfobacteraceae bacterium]|nr:MAG: M20 family metallo-hydrolase [Desulfobacteraceae bacterium]